MDSRKRSIKTAGVKFLVTLPLSGPHRVTLGFYSSPMQVEDTVPPTHQATLGDRQDHREALKHA